MDAGLAPVHHGESVDGSHFKLAHARDAVGRAERGETMQVDAGVDPRALLGDLLTEGVLSRALVLLDREGPEGRIVVLPRRAGGALTLAELLEEDHRRLDELAERACEHLTVDPPLAVECALDFARGLRRHMAAEEAILFPPYEAHFGLSRTSTTAVVEREHKAALHYVDRLVHAAQGVARASEAARDAAVAGALRVHKALVTLLQAHAEKEERAMFPQLDERLGQRARDEAIRRLVLF